jgi:hypothetical protein
LDSNECINENFKDSTAIAKLPRIASASCGFEEVSLAEELLKIAIFEAEKCMIANAELETQLKAKSEMLNIIQTKYAEVNERDAKIRILEEKIQRLSINEI